MNESSDRGIWLDEKRNNVHTQVLLFHFNMFHHEWWEMNVQKIKKLFHHTFITFFTFYTGFTKFINQIFNTYVFQTLLYTLSCVQQKNDFILVLDIGDRNTTHVFASKGTHFAFSN